MLPHHSAIRILHVWDTRVNSGANIDDRLAVTSLEQLSVSRVLVGDGNEYVFSQRALHTLTSLKSPYPRNIFFRQLSKIRFRFYLKKQIRIFKPDVIFFHFGQTAASLMKSLERFQIPFVIAFYGHDISVALKQARWLHKYKIFAKTSGRYLVLSNGVKRRVSNLGIDPLKISVYNYPLDLKLYLDTKKVTTSPIYTITIPGRLVEKKGHIVLFQAVALLKASGTIVKLRVLGYGDSWTYFKEMASKIGIEAQIDWIDSADSTINGNFDNLYSTLLATTDLVVLPCITSSAGDDEAGPALVLCLAQASGTAVLTTPFEGHEVSISDAETGFLSEVGDPSDLAEKILFCINNPMAVSRVAEAGKLHVQEVFNQNRNLGIILDVITAQAQMKESK